MYEQVVKTSGADVLSSRKKLQKILRVGGGGGVATREHDLVKIFS